MNLLMVIINFINVINYEFKNCSDYVFVIIYVYVVIEISLN